jgi:phytoene dehydrogenase-like protein
MTNPKNPPNKKVRPLDTPSAGGRGIRRRDFLNGLLVGASGVLMAPLLEGCEKGGETGGNNPPPPPAGPQFKGDNNSICHAVRDGKMFTLPPASGDLYDCVIVGGGISGLVAARKLQKLGVAKILLLEKEAPAGGMAKLDGDPAYSQAAAYTVFPYNDNLYEVYEDLGVITGYEGDGTPIVDPKYLIKAPTNSDYVDGKWVVDSWEEAGMDALPFPLNVIDGLKSFRLDMIDWYNYVGKDKLLAFDTPTDSSTMDAAVRELDNMTLAEYVASKGWAPEVSQFFDPYIRSALGTTHDKVSAWAAIGFLGCEFHPVLSQPGGNAYLAEGLITKLGEGVIKTDAFVLRVKNEGEEVHVSYLEGDVVTTVRAKTAIYAANRYIARHILPDLVAAGRDEAKDFKYTPYIVANVHVSKTPPGLGYDNWIQGSDFFFTDFIVADWTGLSDPANAQPGRPNTLSVYCPLFGVSARAELLSKPFEEYEEAVLADLERVLPGVRETVTGVDLYRWGHAMLSAEKGFVFGASRVGSQAPIGRTSFACHDVDGLPAFENAVGAAYRAVSEVATILGV